MRGGVTSVLGEMVGVTFVLRLLWKLCFREEGGLPDFERGIQAPSCLLPSPSWVLLPPTHGYPADQRVFSGQRASLDLT